MSGAETTRRADAPARRLAGFARACTRACAVWHHARVNLLVLETIRSKDAVWNVPDGAMADLRARFPGIRIESPAGRDDLERLLADAGVVLGPGVRPRNFPLARRLRWIHLPSAGVEHALFPELLASDVVITHTRGVHDDAMAEHALGVMLAFARQLHRARDAQRERRWSQRELWTGPPAFEALAGTTLVIVGYGSIGHAVARRARALGQTVIGVRRRPTGPDRDADEVHGMDALDRVLPRADWVLLLAPLTGATRGLLSRERLALLKPTARLVNLGRGALVDESALIDALRAGRLAGAGLDVCAEEPLPEASPLWELPNVILTPHVSGLGPRYWERVLEPFAENLRRFLAGAPLADLVDKQAGY